MQHPPLKLGVLGAARIALNSVIPAASRSGQVEITAVASMGGVKAGAVREAAPDARIFEDYEALLEGGDADAVYIPLPNSMHVEWTLRAIEAGKHVLCEKPFSQDAEAAERAVAAAESAGLTLMEGFMYRMHPQTRRLRGLLAGGAIGEVRQALAEFGHRLDDPEDVRGVGTLGGGSLGDVGCYCVSGLRLVFGGEPLRASAVARFDGDGADTELAGVLEFEEGLGVISSSLTSARRERLEVVGTEGRILLQAPFRADKAGGGIELTQEGETTTETFEAADPYLSEIEEFAAAISEAGEPAVGPQEILRNARAIDPLLTSARNGGEAVKL